MKELKENQVQTCYQNRYGSMPRVGRLQWRLFKSTVTKEAVSFQIDKADHIKGNDVRTDGFACEHNSLRMKQNPGEFFSSVLD